MTKRKVAPKKSNKKAKKPIKKATSKRKVKKVIKPVKKQAKKPFKLTKSMPRKVPGLIGQCESCGCDIWQKQIYGRWSDDVITCSSCSPGYEKHRKEKKKAAPKPGAQPKWLRDIAATMPEQKAKPQKIVSSAKVKLVRFRRETDKEYRARVGDAKQEARLTRRGRKLSNKEIAYLMLHNSLTVYADIATLSEMQTAAGHKLRPSRVTKIRNVLRKRAGKMLKYVNVLLLKRGIIEEDISYAEAQSNPSEAVPGSRKRGHSVQSLESFIDGRG